MLYQIAEAVIVLSLCSFSCIALAPLGLVFQLIFSARNMTNNAIIAIHGTWVSWKNGNNINNDPNFWHLSVNVFLLLCILMRVIRTYRGKETQKNSEVSQQMNKKINIGENPIWLAFSGGGLRSCSFASGALNYFETNNIPVTKLSSVSGGGYCCGSYAVWKYPTGPAQNPNVYLNYIRIIAGCMSVACSVEFFSNHINAPPENVRHGHRLHKATLLVSGFSFGFGVLIFGFDTLSALLHQNYPEKSEKYKYRAPFVCYLLLWIVTHCNGSTKIDQDFKLFFHEKLDMPLLDPKQRFWTDGLIAEIVFGGPLLIFGGIVSVLFYLPSKNNSDRRSERLNEWRSQMRKRVGFLVSIDEYLVGRQGRWYSLFFYFPQAVATVFDTILFLCCMFLFPLILTIVSTIPSAVILTDLASYHAKSLWSIKTESIHKCGGPSINANMWHRKFNETHIEVASIRWFIFLSPLLVMFIFLGLDAFHFIRSSKDTSKLQVSIWRNIIVIILLLIGLISPKLSFPNLGEYQINDSTWLSFFALLGESITNFPFDCTGLSDLHIIVTTTIIFTCYFASLFWIPEKGTFLFLSLTISIFSFFVLSVRGPPDKEKLNYIPAGLMLNDSSLSWLAPFKYWVENRWDNFILMAAATLSALPLIIDKKRVLVHYYYRHRLSRSYFPSVANHPLDWIFHDFFRIPFSFSTAEFFPYNRSPLPSPTDLDYQIQIAAQLWSHGGDLGDQSYTSKNLVTVFRKGEQATLRTCQLIPGQEENQPDTSGQSEIILTPQATQSDEYDNQLLVLGAATSSLIGCTFIYYFIGDERIFFILPLNLVMAFFWDKFYYVSRHSRKYRQQRTRVDVHDSPTNQSVVTYVAISGAAVGSSTGEGSTVPSSIVGFFGGCCGRWLSRKKPNFNKYNVLCVLVFIFIGISYFFSHMVFQTRECGFEWLIAIIIAGLIFVPVLDRTWLYDTSSDLIISRFFQEVASTLNLVNETEVGSYLFTSDGGCFENSALLPLLRDAMERQDPTKENSPNIICFDGAFYNDSELVGLISIIARARATLNLRCSILTNKKDFLSFYGLSHPNNSAQEIPKNDLIWLLQALKNKSLREKIMDITLREVDQNIQDAHDDDRSFFTFNPPVEHNENMKNVLELEFTTFKRAEEVNYSQNVYPRSGTKNFAESTASESMELPIKVYYTRPRRNKDETDLAFLDFNIIRGISLTIIFGTVFSFFGFVIGGTIVLLLEYAVVVGEKQKEEQILYQIAWLGKVFAYLILVGQILTKAKAPKLRPLAIISFLTLPLVQYVLSLLVTQHAIFKERNERFEWKNFVLWWDIFGFFFLFNQTQITNEDTLTTLFKVVAVWMLPIIVFHMLPRTELEIYFVFWGDVGMFIGFLVGYSPVLMQTLVGRFPNHNTAVMQVTSDSNIYEEYSRAGDFVAKEVIDAIGSNQSKVGAKSVIPNPRDNPKLTVLDDEKSCMSCSGSCLF